MARRFLATLMGPATVEGTKVSIDRQRQPFVSRGDVLVDPDTRRSTRTVREGRGPSGHGRGQTVGFLGATSEEKQTQPPKRYSQGGLIQEMEKRGLGTKATRHAIIETLYDRGYIEKRPRGSHLPGPCGHRCALAFAPRHHYARYDARA